jgi:adenine/guanine phosphoribosyltransferase-like PRPP-binding protein
VSLIRRLKDKFNALADSPSKLLSTLPRAAKGVKRSVRRERYRTKLRSGDVDFVTIDELAVWTREFVDQLPETYDLVVGIPRSGMLVASIIATKLGRPLSTPDLFLEDRWWSSRLLESPDPSEVHSILLVDDSIDRGSSLEAAKAILARRERPTRITTAALIAHRRDASGMVDLHHRVIAHPVIFEWNLMHAKVMTRLSANLEGVLDRPGRIPSYSIDVVLASGDESNRQRAEAFLLAQGVRFGELVMMSGRDKVDVLEAARSDIHLEGPLEEAQRIASATGIPTISLDEMELAGSLR